MLIIALAAGGGGLLVVVVVVAVVCECWRRSGSRSNHNAPNGSSNVAIIFTDIKTSTKLWGGVPASMGIALDAHHSLIRGAISAYSGYEVKTVGDSFMIAVDDPQRAVNLAVAIQNALYDYEWPTAIDDSYACNFSEAILDDPDDVCGPEVDAPWNGLRVRIGIHYGPVEVILDAVTKGYDYYGTTVNVAARVEGVTDGGQVCASAAVLAAVTPTTSMYTSVMLAKTALRGVREEMEVYEIRPTHLPTRSFNNPLIFDDDAKINMMNQHHAETEGSSLSTGATHTSQLTPLTHTTRPIRNIIREAFKAIRGSERVQLLEKLRSAWRVELPSGKAFRGISAAQLAKKEQSAGKPIKKRAAKPTSRMVHSNVSMYALELAALNSMSEAGSSDVETSYSHTSDVVEYDEEDTLFHVIAQRVEPSVAMLLRTSAPRRGSSLQMNNSNEVVSFNLSGAGYTAGSIHQSAMSPVVSMSGTSLANLFDVRSFLGTSSASANPEFSVGAGSALVPSSTSKGSATAAQGTPFDMYNSSNGSLSNIEVPATTADNGIHQRCANVVVVTTPRPYSSVGESETPLNEGGESKASLSSAH